MSYPKLKRCPICGGGAVVQSERLPALKTHTYWVECDECGLSYRQNIRFTKQAAIHCWNGGRVSASRNRASVFMVRKLTEILKDTVQRYGKPGGPWNIPGEPGSWIQVTRQAIKEAEEYVKGENGNHNFM